MPLQPDAGGLRAHGDWSIFRAVRRFGERALLGNMGPPPFFIGQPPHTGCVLRDILAMRDLGETYVRGSRQMLVDFTGDSHQMLFQFVSLGPSESHHDCLLASLPVPILFRTDRSCCGSGAKPLPAMLAHGQPGSSHTSAGGSHLDLGSAARPGRLPDALIRME